ncbi:hypothetical protein [Odoribacter sp. Z80]|nr:hypothetical protein [Odoribacter sp. Z80]
MIKMLTPVWSTPVLRIGVNAYACVECVLTPCRSARLLRRGVKVEIIV